MSPRESLDRSRKAAEEVLSEVAKQQTQDTRLRGIAQALLALGFEFQFERDRAEPRRKIEALLQQVLAAGEDER